MLHSRPVCNKSPAASGRRGVWLALQACVCLFIIRNEVSRGTQLGEGNWFLSVGKLVVSIIRDRTVEKKTSVHLHTANSSNYIHLIFLESITIFLHSILLKKIFNLQS
jgi:hypothetical protein